MERSIIFDENLTYDSLYDQSSNLKEDYELDTQIYVDDDFELKNEEKKYSKEEVENILKESIENMVIEIKKVIDKKFGEYNFVASYNKYIDNWNEVVCSIDIDGQVVDVKLSNDYICDDANNISSIYITVFNDGKGVFTECIERINQEYEFNGSTYAYVPINENELCFKRLDKDKIIECIVYEINKIM